MILKLKNIQIFMKKKLYFIICLLIYFLFFDSKIFNISKTSNIKICICTMGKKENRYIREFVEYFYMTIMI